ncbi:MAG: T9SS type A sorting domain-containing protein [Janthinobacterium lividum]
MYTRTFFQHSLVARPWGGRLLLLFLLVATGFSSLAQTITGPDQIYIDQTHTGSGTNTIYAAQNGTGTAISASGTQLGTYALSNANNIPEQLILNGGQIYTTEPTSATARFTSAQLVYRIFPINNAGTTIFNTIDLPEVTSTVSSDGATTTRQFSSVAGVASNTPGVDLIAGVSAAGNYTLEMYLQVTYATSNGNTTNYDRLSPPSLNYQTNFAVIGARFNTLTWTGEISDNWFDAANWDKGRVPTKTDDAYIQYPAPNSRASYPKIYSNGRYQLPQYNPGTTNPYTGPTYNNTTGTPYGIAEVQSISFGGTSAGAAQAELVTGTLIIYGNLVNTYNNFVQDNNTILVFGGDNQTITGGTFKVVEIAGGGTKSISSDMTITTSLRFGSSAVVGSAAYVAGKGNVATAPTNSTVTLDQNSTTAAMLIGEDETGYVLGNVETRVQTLLNIPQTYGNIGLSLTFTGTNMPGFVTVRRVTGSYYSAGLNSPSAVSIKRSFVVTPDNASNSAMPLTANVVFSYLDIDRMNIGGTTGPTIPDGPTTTDPTQPNVLSLFRSATGTSFTNLGFTSRDGNLNTVTTNNVQVFNILTLGDERNPLPVSLVAFNAKRLGSDALITWETAMERDNRGFEVQVSTDGVTFRTVGFVASNTPDSNTHLAYSYTDTEANKSGIRYYRLHQLDYSGKDDYSPVRAVSFAAAGDAVATLTAYPNPFSNDEIKLALQSTDAGQATLRLTDLTGRQVSAQSFTAVKGVTEVSIDQASQLAAGSYMAQITSPSGEVKTVRIQKR